MSEMEYEQNKLDIARSLIKKELDVLEDSCSQNLDSFDKEREYYYDTLPEMDDYERAFTEMLIDTSASMTNNGLAILRKLRKALVNPYKGKIIYEIDDEDNECYIGLTTIVDDNITIVDWRSPIADLFYDSPIGKTSYEAPIGKVDCVLKERKQIKIKEGKVIRVVSSKDHLDDDILQEILNEASSEKMKDIIGTIQKEQNMVIRNTNDKLIVQGCAGSGKTSVALHRLAYLLYKDKNSKEENMLVISPNDTFSEYINSVLPSMGDGPVEEKTFNDFTKMFGKEFTKIESFREFITNYYEGLYNNEEEKSIRFKMSSEYKKSLDKFITNYFNNIKFKNDVKYNGLVYPSSFLNRMLEFPNIKELPIQDKVDELTEIVYNNFAKKDRKASRNVIKKTIEKTLGIEKIDAKKLYNSFLSSEEFTSYTNRKEKLDKGVLSFPDSIGLIYMFYELKGYPKNVDIHHLVIDEVQDYTPLQMEIICKKYEGASITALGDVNQTINPFFKYDSLEELNKIIGANSKYIELNKAYRSTKNIMEYSNEIISNSNIVPIRTKDVPIVFKEVDKKDLARELVTDIAKLKEEGQNRICIITKGIRERDALYEVLKEAVPNIKVISKDEDSFKDVSLSTSYDSKGLEFDAIINYNDRDNEYEDSDKYLYYVASTRAEHKLVVYNEPHKIKKIGGK